MIKSVSFTESSDTDALVNKEVKRSYDEPKIESNITEHMTTDDNPPQSNITDLTTDDKADRCTTNCVVHIKSEYGPKALTVPVGTTVTWNNERSTVHSVTSVETKFAGITPVFNSYGIAPGEQYEYTFNKKWIFDYYCNFADMEGKIIVE